MQAQLLTDWVVSLLPIYNIRKISAITHFSSDRTRAVHDARSSETPLLYIHGLLGKATPEIKQAVVEFTLRNPIFLI
jgi:hypothetical protein